MFYWSLFLATIPVVYIVGVVGKATMEVRLTAGNLEYTNQASVGPGAYFRISRKSRNSIPVLNAFFPMLKDLPADTNISWHCYQKINNAWVSTMVKGSAALCEMLESKNKIQRIMFEFSNLPQKCPVKKGNYTIKDFYVKTDGLPPVIPGSDWKAHSSWGTAKTNFLTYNFELKILRRDRNGQGGSEAATALAVNG